MNFETLQTIIIVAVSIATILLTIIGLQIIYLLKDLSLVVKRAEKISRGLSFINNVFEKASAELDSFSQGAKFFWNLINRFKRKNEDE